ncbi:MAG: coproporphyrinogen dehydrogenase HemZ [Clostridia bacterium]|nr:coproporphyrinogen dehydrogenase HemZ [Clostridia bacterium]
MILHIHGDINRYYVETLCLIFFPGSTFKENEESAQGVPEVTVSVYSEKDKSATAYVSIKLNDKICDATETVFYSENICIATHEAIAVGRAMLAAGKELVGHIPPWGILTGVRPAKVARSVFDSVKGIIKTKRILRDEYFLNPQKAALAVSSAVAEMRIERKLKKNSCSIYISIPFCPSRCAYCSFVSYTTPRLLSMIDEYLGALIRDLRDTVTTVSSLGMSVSTLYIGGGTPTTLTAEQLRRLLSTVSELIDVNSLQEFTLEAGRPDTITKEKLDIAREYGVSRISVNPQTLNDDILAEIGRRHTVLDFYRAYELAKESGFNINVDLIAGLPGDDFKNFSETIDKVIALAPTNVTVHTFSVKKASDALKNNSGVYSLSGGDAAKCVSYSQIKLKYAGYKPYYMYRQKNTVGNLENVGFSVEGGESLYNVFMMEELQTIFAVGAGAVTKLVRRSGGAKGETVLKRIFRPKYPYEYLRDFGGENRDIPSQIKSEILDFFSSDE